MPDNLSAGAFGAELVAGEYAGGYPLCMLDFIGGVLLFAGLFFACLALWWVFEETPHDRDRH